MPVGVTWTRPRGGFSILVGLPRGYSSIALLLSAIDKGVSFLPGPIFGHRSTLRQRHAPQRGLVEPGSAERGRRTVGRLHRGIHPTAGGIPAPAGWATINSGRRL
ncbi:MAG: hypothetical protein P8010_08635 [Desulfosarcinaceae bacterium]